MNYIVAVSGGVDSVVLLHQLVRAGQRQLVVAHVNHGMRPEADADARFVAGLAKQYGLPYEEHRAALGEDASEEVARQARYGFLFAVARRYDAQVVTAHHADDVVETVALNLRRGTRWRGLAGMSDARITRPLVNWTKQDIYDYATRHRLEWVEDSTNHTARYTRNQIRRRLAAISPEQQMTVRQLWRRQLTLRQDIDYLLQRTLWPLTERYVIIMLPREVALEAVWWACRQLGASLLTLQLERALLAITTGRPGTQWQLGGGIVLRVGRRDWQVQLLPNDDKIDEVLN